MSAVTWVSLVHSEAGVGKSWLADTLPAPRLILDAEGGSEFTPSRPKALWNPLQYAPPGVDGCAPGQEQVPPTTRVLVSSAAVLERAWQWLNAGMHRFRSVAFDSVTEGQKRHRDSISGAAPMEQRDWGALLIAMETTVRGLRDLRLHPTNPVQCVMLLALTDPEKKGAKRPLIQGAIANTLSGYVDTVGYLYVQMDADNNLRRCLMTAPFPGHEAKDRTNALPQVALMSDPERGLEGHTMETLLALVEQKHGGNE